MAAWQLLQGLETLHGRMERHGAKDHEVAKVMQGNSQVAEGQCPGTHANKDYARNQK